MSIYKRLIFSFALLMIFLSPAMVSFAGTLLIDFDNGKMEGWERSPQNQKNNSIFWGIVDKSLMFDPKGQAWDQSISQMNFVGNNRITNVREWKDYEFQADIKHKELANWPGGIRARVDLDTGGHYVVWLYPGDSRIKLYKNPGWDINTGIQALGEAPYKPDADKFHSVKISCMGDAIKVFYDNNEVITAKDNEHKKGTIAFCVQDKAVYYDNIKVTGTDIPNINMSPVEPQDKLSTAWGSLKLSYDR